MYQPRKGTRGFYNSSTKSPLGFTVISVEGNLCYCKYDDGTDGPFIWRSKEGLNTLHDWPGKFETREVVIRYFDILECWSICYAKSYQPTFRSSVNKFETFEKALEHIEQHNKENLKLKLVWVWHEHDQLNHK